MIARWRSPACRGSPGFFSKDEILFETFATGTGFSGSIGVLTSLLTATYMFRLVFLTFFGERRHDAPAPATSRKQDADCTRTRTTHTHAAPRTCAPTSHGTRHRSHLHDAPPAMALALIVLAIGSVARRLRRHPARARRAQRARRVARAGVRARPVRLRQSGRRRSGGRKATAGEESSRADADGRVERSSRSSASASRTFIWLKRREIADRLARDLRGVYRLLLNKYYVDELYDATIVQPIKVVSTEGLWRGFDVKVIDGAVNGAGAIVDGWRAVLRRLQTGSVRTYAARCFVGVVLILGYYLWR